MNAMTLTRHAICMPVSLSGVGVVVKAIHRVIETQGKLRLAVDFQLEEDGDARGGRRHIHPTLYGKEFFFRSIIYFVISFMRTVCGRVRDRCYHRVGYMGREWRGRGDGERW